MVDPAPSAACRIWFEGLTPEEEVRFYFRQHWIRLLPPLLRALLLSLGLILVGFVVFFVLAVPDDFSHHGILIGLLSCFVAIQLYFLMRCYRYFLYLIIVTDRKIHRIKKTLLSTDDHDAVDIWTLQDIHKRQSSVIQNIFGYGSLILESQDTELRLHFVPRVGKLYEKICELREAARAKMPTGMVGVRREEGAKLQ